MVINVVVNNNKHCQESRLLYLMLLLIRRARSKESIVAMAINIVANNNYVSMGFACG
uniref:Uncharacterized protein n=1 Tax=Rhizophora mucronata TaxID=61149 RepID=A0A2P2QFP0_RHIMU